MEGFSELNTKNIENWHCFKTMQLKEEISEGALEHHVLKRRCFEDCPFSFLDIQFCPSFHPMRRKRFSPIAFFQANVKT